MVNQSVVDCQKQVSAATFFAWYVGPNATGETVNFMTVPESQLQFQPIIPNSLADIQAKLACALPGKGEQGAK